MRGGVLRVAGTHGGDRCHRGHPEHYPQLGSVNTPRIRCSCRAESGFEIRYNQFQNWTKVVSRSVRPMP